MGSPFNFRTELQWKWDKLKVYAATSKNEVNNLYHAYKDQYFEVDGDKRKDLKHLMKNRRIILTQAKSDWDNLTIVKKKRESDRKVDKTHGVFQETWEPRVERLVEMGFEGFLALLMESDRAAERHFAKYLPSVVERLYVKLISADTRYHQWRLAYDDDFARQYCSTRTTSNTTPQLQCCLCCRQILLDGKNRRLPKIQSPDLLHSAEQCQICTLLVKAFEQYVEDDGTINVFRSGTALRAGIEGPRVVRFCTGSVEYAANREHRHPPIGLPLPRTSKPELRYELVRQWLHWCDGHSTCVTNSQNPTYFPSRVVDVGNPSSTDLEAARVRLVGRLDRQGERYIALSHCWGDVPDLAKREYCTSTANLSARMSGFELATLPKTFQNAVEVARAVHIPYIWIDSLCIIQYGDDGEDWKREAREMENVFSQAYCTIAATAATSSLSGFLDCHLDTEWVNVEAGPGLQFYISTDVDDFDRDIEDATLNKRAWVLQELVLSRRTVHFSSRQMYFECGEGIHCENLVRLTSVSRSRSFVLDPDFPSRLLQNNEQWVEINCIMFLIKEYSQRHLTFLSDRPLAIAGLEQRMAKATRTEIPEINRADGAQVASSVPTWSWMAASGGVRFFSEKYNPDLAFNTELGFHKEHTKALTATGVGKFVDLAQLQALLKTPSRNELAEVGEGLEGGLWFDTGAEVGPDDLYCVFVLRSGTEVGGWYSVLLVVPTENVEEYIRVGVGMIRIDWVLTVRKDVQVV